MLTPMPTIHDFSAKLLSGEHVDLGAYRGDVLLIVNTASECGFTPQYAGLQRLHEQYGPRGLRVLGFPCNQFGRQEPGNGEQIAGFCTSRFGVTFPMFQKIDVNGPDAAPLYRYLTREAPGILGTRRIKWNFTKFLVSRDGSRVRRYGPRHTPEKLVADIERMLAEPGR